MDKHLSLRDLNDAERRGAMVALDHVRRRGLQMQRNATAKQMRHTPKAQRTTLLHAGRMVRNTAHALRRELFPDLKDHHFRD